VPLTSPERRLRALLYAHAVLSVGFVAYYVAGGIVEHQEFRFVINSATKDGLFVLVSVLAAADVRRRGWMTWLLIAAYATLVASELVMLTFGDRADVQLFWHTSYLAFLLPWIAADVAILAVLSWAWWRAEQARFGLRYLNPLAFRTLVALVEVLIDGEHEAVPPLDVARNVDGYLASLNAGAKWRVQAALTALAVWPLLTLRLPFPAMTPAARERYLERRFLDDVAQRRVLAPLRPLVQAMLRVCSQMAYLGYYGDRRSWPEVGYTPFVRRRGGRAPVPGDRPEPPLRVRSSPPRAGEPRYDAVVVGSGAAGAILAYRLAESGRRVLVLERGPHVDPGDFSDDEVEQYLRLYNEGALQLVTDFRLQVLQGMCVGGSTTVNNAVCIDPPDEVLAAWERRNGVPADDVRIAMGQVAAWLPITKMPQRVASPAALRWAAGLESLELPGRLDLVHANISEDCLGCGYCNIGCAYGKKLSMLDSVLPRAQHECLGDVDVLADFRVLEVVRDGRRAVGLLGEWKGRERMTIVADEVVIAAGAIASSWLLQRSGIGGDRPGRELHFNVNSPLTAEFPEPVDAFAGLQMSHAYQPDGTPGWIIESWFNPPAIQSLAMPGWFRRHYRNMRRYRHMASAGVLVGTTTPGSVKAKRDGPQIRYTPSRADLGRVVDGLEVAGRAFFAAGAARVLPATYAWHEFADARQLPALAGYVRDNADLLLTTAHPQGGNPLGDVVDEHFRVRGFENLYLCDASVFPSSVTVNPQKTVMGLAWLAGSRITGAASLPHARVTRAHPPGELAAAPGSGASSPAAYPRASGRAGA
jgi:choline dehydrogenase-like flavoprotein